MRYSFDWLKELSGTKLSPEKAAGLLTMHSFEIEGLEKNNSSLDGVVVGEILEITKHPNADKLQIAIVETRHASSRLQIVCGAPNIAVGQKVPVALVGTILPGGLEIKAAEIRGVKSFGMLCAEDELGLGKDHAGILILEKFAKIGEPVGKYLGNDDSVIEIKVLPDRAHDILSHVGVARELAVLEKKKFTYASDELVFPAKKSQKLKVEIKDKDLCKRYIGVVMENITIKESPKWLKERLEVCGLRPINNVVDATNYVMLELGQPLHAFDLEKIKVQKSKIKMTMQNEKCNIVVRRAKNNEMLTLLDDSRIKLNENNLLITNGDNALALAGVMGGKNSGISENTTTIVLEAASFDAVNIRKTRTALGLNTDSSYRFEKDLDPNLTEKAMVRVIDILEHIADGKLEGIVDFYPKKIKSWTVKLDLNYVNQLLGENVPPKEIVKILNLLGIHTKYKILNTKYSSIECEIPTYRFDLRTQEDLIEDIGRIWGYEKITPRPMIAQVLPAKINRQVFFERKMQDILTGLGFDEVYNYSFYGADDLKKTGLSEKEHLQLANPMNPDQQFVRAELAVNILKNVRENLKNFSEFGIFEIGKCYALKNNEPIEERNLILARVLEKDSNSETFYDLKGAVEDSIEASIEASNLKLEFLEIEKTGTLMNPGRTAKISLGAKVIGFVGEVNQAVLTNYKISKRLAIAEINLGLLRQGFGGPKKNTLEYKSINKFPVVSRDISMIVPRDVKYTEIETLVRKTGGELVNDVSLFDRFETKNSMAIRIEMSAKDRTLESVEIDAVMEKIISRLEKSLKIEIRK